MSPGATSRNAPPWSRNASRAATTRKAAARSWRSARPSSPASEASSWERGRPACLPTPLIARIERSEIRDGGAAGEAVPGFRFAQSGLRQGRRHAGEGARRLGVASVELRNLTKRYAKSPVVDDVSLHIEHGLLVCLLGPSGCGKT